MLNLEKRTNGTEEESPVVHRPAPAVVDRQQYEQWISDEFTVIYRELARLAATKRQKGRPVIYLASPGEVLEAFRLDVITKAEARRLLGQRGTGEPRRTKRKVTQATLDNLAKARAARAVKPTRTRVTKPRAKKRTVRRTVKR